MKSDDVLDLLSVMNTDDCELTEIRIFFDGGYEIEFDQNDDAWLFKGDKALCEIYFFEDLMFEEVLKYDGEEYKFKYFLYNE